MHILCHLILIYTICDMQSDLDRQYKRKQKKNQFSVLLVNALLQGELFNPFPNDKI